MLLTLYFYFLCYNDIIFKSNCANIFSRVGLTVLLYCYLSFCTLTALYGQLDFYCGILNTIFSDNTITLMDGSDSSSESSTDPYSNSGPDPSSESDPEPDPIPDPIPYPGPDEDNEGGYNSDDSNNSSDSDVTVTQDNYSEQQRQQELVEAEELYEGVVTVIK